MASFYPSAGNTFVPQAQKALQADFSRNPKRFKVLNYVTSAPVDQKIGYYTVYDPDESARHTGDLDDLWADGSYATVNHADKVDRIEFNTKRFQRSFTIGSQAIKQADWDVVAQHADSAAARLMTGLTARVIEQLDTSGNWATGHTDTCTNFSGGKWDVATDALPYITKGIAAGIRQLELASNSNINPEDCILLVGSGLASRMAVSQEIIQMMKFYPQDYFNANGILNGSYGLPPKIHGVSIVVENAVKVTSEKGAARAASYIAGDNAWLLVRPGASLGNLNTMSTVTVPMFEEMSVQIRNDDFHRLTEGHVTLDHGVIVRGNAGIRFTDCSAG